MPIQVNDAERVCTHNASFTKRWTTAASHRTADDGAHGARVGSDVSHGRAPAVAGIRCRACNTTQHRWTYGIQARNQACQRVNVDGSAATAAVTPSVANASKRAVS
jgi:hypothetical protein